MIVELAASNVVLQTIVDDDKRGRVMSFYTMAFMGMTPFGSLLAGTLASQIGAPMTLLLGGVACIAGALTFASRLSSLRLHVRPIYVARGILPGPRRPRPRNVFMSPNRSLFPHCAVVISYGSAKT